MVGGARPTGVAPETSRTFAVRAVLVGTVAIVVGLMVAAFAGASHVTPELVEGTGNRTCGQLAGQGQSWIELKVDPNANGVYSDGTLTVTISNTQNDKTFDWSSNIGVDAVFVKAGAAGSYLYRYDPPSEATSDTGLTSPGSGSSNQISHISFCYDVEPKGNLTVVKHVVNDDGGTAVASSWTMNVAGPTPLSFAGAEAPGTTNVVDAGSYTVTESGGPSGYTLTYSGDCDANGNVTVLANQTRTCTLTNDDQPATLIVKKVVVNDDGGTATAAEFSFSVNGGAPQAFEADGENVLSVDPGTYSVTEPAVAGYETSYDNCTDLVIPAGGSATCTITNDDEPATLIVIKHVVNDGGGTAVAANWTMSVVGPTPLSFAGAEAPGTANQVSAGDYSIIESGGPAGYALTYSGDCDEDGSVTLALGESKTCTLTNDDLAATLTVIKHVVNDDGGSAAAGDWTMNVAGPTGLSFAGEESPGTTNAVDPGDYAVAEAGGPAGYALTYAGDCDAQGNVTIALGESKTCTLTNDDQPASLTVIKHVVNDNGGTAVASDWTMNVAGPSGSSFAGAEAPGTTNAVDPGSYAITESGGPSGYALTYSGDCDISGNVTIGLGEAKTCTLTNNDLAQGQGSIDVQKSATPTSMKEPGGPVTFSVRITNTSTVNVTITEVFDNVFGDLDDSGGNGCFDVPINLAPGASSTCQFVAPVTGPAGTVHVNTVTASGSDEFGNPVSGSDDARVELTPLLIDLVIVKDASSPTPLNGIVNYTLTVSNKGPDTATNVQLADPAPVAITYLTVNTPQGSCNLTLSLVTCNLGSLAAGQTVTITITARATAVGTHVNTATVTGGGGRELNPADNVDLAQTVVPAPLVPPTVKPKPTQPKPQVCLTLTVTPKMITADGKPDRVSVRVTAGKKRMKGVKVAVRGVGVNKTARSNGQGIARLSVNPKRSGIVTITAVETNQRVCGAKRVGVVGVFLPPLTG